MIEEPIIWSTGTLRCENLCDDLAKVTGFRRQHVADFPWKAPVPSIVYGILRGCSEIIRICQTAGVPYWQIDHGYFGRGDPDLRDGYYRISKNALYTRMPLTWVPGQAERQRFDSLGLKIGPRRDKLGKKLLICPPTLPAAAHYGVNPEKWVGVARRRYAPGVGYLVRDKGAAMPICDAFDQSCLVVAYNSNIAIDALIAGIPSVQDEGPVNNFQRRIGTRWNIPIWLANNQWKLPEVTRGVFGCVA